MRLPAGDQWLMVEGVFCLLKYSFLIYLMPFRWWERRIGQKMQPWQQSDLMPEQMQRIARVRRGVFRANREIGRAHV